MVSCIAGKFFISWATRETPKYLVVTTKGTGTLNMRVFKIFYLFVFGCATSSLVCGLFSSYGMWASHCDGFFCWGDTGSMRLGLLACELSICGSQAREHSLNNNCAWVYLLFGMWDLPRSGIEPLSPALAARFSSTEPPGKSKCEGIKNIVTTSSSHISYW